MSEVFWDLMVYVFWIVALSGTFFCRSRKCFNMISELAINHDDVI